MTTRRLILAATPALLAAPALAQPRWPVRPVTMLCPWAAGGGTDAVLRIVAAQLEKELGQPFNVVNRTGGSGVVGGGVVGGSGVVVGGSGVEGGSGEYGGSGVDGGSVSYGGLETLTPSSPGS